MKLIYSRSQNPSTLQFTFQKNTQNEIEQLKKGLLKQQEYGLVCIHLKVHDDIYTVNLENNNINLILMDLKKHFLDAGLTKEKWINFIADVEKEHPLDNELLTRTTLNLDILPDDTALSEFVMPLLDPRSQAYFRRTRKTIYKQTNDYESLMRLHFPDEYKKHTALLLTEEKFSFDTDNQAFKPTNTNYKKLFNKAYWNNYKGLSDRHRALMTLFKAGGLEELKNAHVMPDELLQRDELNMIWGSDSKSRSLIDCACINQRQTLLNYCYNHIMVPLYQNSSTHQLDVAAAVGQHNMTVLHWAAYLHQPLETILDLINLLKQKNPEKMPHDAGIALVLSARQGNIDVVKALLTNNEINTQISDQHKYIALTWAARNGHTGIVKTLLSAGLIDITAPLLMAARYGHIDNVNVLLLRADVNNINITGPFDGYTALISAAKHGHIDIVKALLTHDQINLNAHTPSGNTALNKAIKFGHTDIAKILLARDDIGISIPNSKGQTALMLAICHDRIEIIQAIVHKLSLQSIPQPLNFRQLSREAAKGMHYKSSAFLLVQAISQLEKNHENEFGELLKSCNELFSKFYKLERLKKIRKETNSETYDDARHWTYLLIHTILNDTLSSGSVLTREQICQLNNAIVEFSEGINLLLLIITQHNSENVNNLKDFAEKISPGKPYFWKGWLEALSGKTNDLLITDCENLLSIYFPENKTDSPITSSFSSEEKSLSNNSAFEPSNTDYNKLFDYVSGYLFFNGDEDDAIKTLLFKTGRLEELENVDPISDQLPLIWKRDSNTSSLVDWACINQRQTFLDCCYDHIIVPYCHDGDLDSFEADTDDDNIDRLDVITEIGQNGMTVLHWAAYLLQSPKTILDLIDLLNERNPERVPHDVGIALLISARHGHLDVINALLTNNKFNIYISDRHKYIILTWAAHHGHVDVVKNLLLTGINDITAPLRIAARYGHTNIETLLVHNRRGNAALNKAIKHGHMDIAMILLARDDIDISIPTHRGETALMLAIRYGRIEIIQAIFHKLNYQDIYSYHQLSRRAAKAMHYKSAAFIMVQNISKLGNDESELNELLKKCNGLFLACDKLGKLKETHPKRYQLGKNIQDQTYLLMYNMLDENISSKSALTLEQITQINNSIDKLVKGVELSLSALTNPNKDNVEALKNFAENEAPGKPSYWKMWLGALLTVVGVVVFILGTVATAGVSLGVTAGIAFGIKLGVTLTGVTVGVSSPFLLFSGRRRGLSKAMNEAAIETKKLYEAGSNYLYSSN